MSPAARDPRRSAASPAVGTRPSREPASGARPRRASAAGPDPRDAPAGDPPSAFRDAPVGGQAVLEGVMMRGVHTWAVAIRRALPEQLTENGLPSGEAALGEIVVETHPFRSVLRRHALLRLPIVRGVVALGQSMGIGMKALKHSANAQLPGEQETVGRGEWLFAIVAGIALAVGLFFVVPVGLTSLIKEQLGSGWLFWLVEGVLRTAIFIAYLVLVTRLRDLRRVFEYHGAEHKTIACFEAGLPLTTRNAERFSRLHPRCGTSFLLIVMIVAIFVFAPIGLPAWYWLVASRILGVPLVAGIAFELIKYAGAHRANPLVGWLIWPGMQLQRLTTQEPDADQLAVAIAALEAVLEHEDPYEASAEDRAGIEVAA